MAASTFVHWTALYARKNVRKGHPVLTRVAGVSREQVVVVRRLGDGDDGRVVEDVVAIHILQHAYRPRSKTAVVRYLSGTYSRPVALAQARGSEPRRTISSPPSATG